MMNYFELYQIPVSFKPDLAIVKQQFYQLSRKYHPDFHTAATEQEQEEMLEMSSLVNTAFKTLSNQQATIQYVLALKGLLDADEKYALPADFLMEMMDLNEQLTDAKMEGESSMLEKVKETIQHKSTEIYEAVAGILEISEANTASQEALLQVKDYYFKKKYLDRILEGL